VCAIEVGEFAIGSGRISGVGQFERGMRPASASGEDWREEDGPVPAGLLVREGTMGLRLGRASGGIAGECCGLPSVFAKGELDCEHFNGRGDVERMLEDWAGPA